MNSTCVVGATDLELLDQRVFIWYRLHVGQTYAGAENTKRLTRQLSLSKTAPRYPALRSAKKSNWRMSFLQQTEHGRSMRRRQNNVLTCDYDMRENDAGIPNELQGCEKTRNVHRHVRIWTRTGTATIKDFRRLVPSRRFGFDRL